MHSELPAPPVPADADLRGLPCVLLDVARLFDSDFYALSTGDEFKAGCSLWWKSWHQLPAGSLPDDDRVLAHLSGAGARWPEVKAVALRGWFKASDGRLYHLVVAEKVNEAWAKRLTLRDRSRRGNAVRWDRRRDGHGDPGRDLSGDPNGDPGREPSGDPNGDARRDPRRNPKEKEKEKQKKNPHSPPSEARPPRGTRLPDDWQPSPTDRDFACSLGLDADAVAARFRDFWRAKAGQQGVKLDWSATWRNWCRQDAERRPHPGQRQTEVPKFRNGFAGALFEDWTAAERASPAPPQPSPTVLIEGVADATE
ncbi:DUF1376 domain-containing protein [Neoroseomonas rubea]|uniref:DUF1376 domain-containing protein n=1 Tax=Neoroseomonas rubea TaxID=2748666 RepID=UPI0018E04094|nr:DUF1376 domain-containing protein [Roseomonas rubea]